jgi:hypothetical protein
MCFRLKSTPFVKKMRAGSFNTSLPVASLTWELFLMDPCWCERTLEGWLRNLERGSPEFWYTSLGLIIMTWDNNWLAQTCKVVHPCHPHCYTPDCSIIKVNLKALVYSLLFPIAQLTVQLHSLATEYVWGVYRTKLELCHHFGVLHAKYTKIGRSIYITVHFCETTTINHYLSAK